MLDCWTAFAAVCRPCVSDHRAAAEVVRSDPGVLRHSSVRLPAERLQRRISVVRRRAETGRIRLRAGHHRLFVQNVPHRPVRPAGCQRPVAVSEPAGWQPGPVDPVAVTSLPCPAAAAPAVPSVRLPVAAASGSVAAIAAVTAEPAVAGCRVPAAGWPDPVERRSAAGPAAVRRGCPDADRGRPDRVRQGQVELRPATWNRRAAVSTAA